MKEYEVAMLDVDHTKAIIIDDNQYHYFGQK